MVTALKYIHFVYVKVIYLYNISKTSSIDHRQPELNCVIKLDNCCVLFPEILAWNLALDKADCYGTSESLAGHIKNAFLTVSSRLWKLRNVIHYWFDNMVNSSSVNSDRMILQ